MSLAVDQSMSPPAAVRLLARRPSLPVIMPSLVPLSPPMEDFKSLPVSRTTSSDLSVFEFESSPVDSESNFNFCDLEMEPELPQSPRSLRCRSRNPLRRSLSLSRLDVLTHYRSHDLSLIEKNESPERAIEITVESWDNPSVTISCHPWNTIADLKDALESYFIRTSSLIRLFYSGKERHNSRTLHDYGISNGDVLFAATVAHGVCSSSGDSIGTAQIQLYGEFKNDGEASRGLVTRCLEGMIVGYVPQLTKDGTGGTYLLKDRSHQTAAVFKPEDEEPLAPNNPRGHKGLLNQPSLRKGILSGEAAAREVAAYVVDTGNFSSVPFTTRVEAMHPAFCYDWLDNSKIAKVASGLRFKVGSLQEFIEFNDMASDVGCQSFPEREVHKIGILDIRIVNTDRNDGNILVQQKGSGTKLVPVDHGFCLPDHLEIAWCDWVWLDWPQSKVHFDSETLRYIRQIDVEEDMKKLRTKLSIRERCLQIMKVTTTILQRGAAAGLTLWDIGKLIARDDLDSPSLAELLVEQAHALAASARRKILQQKRKPHIPTLVRSSSCFDVSEVHLQVDNSSLADSLHSDKYVWDHRFWRYFNMLVNQTVEKKLAEKRRSDTSSIKNRRNSYSVIRDLHLSSSLK